MILFNISPIGDPEVLRLSTKEFYVTPYKFMAILRANKELKSSYPFYVDNKNGKDIVIFGESEKRVKKRLSYPGYIYQISGEKFEKFPSQGASAKLGKVVIEPTKILLLEKIDNLYDTLSKLVTIKFMKLNMTFSDNEIEVIKKLLKTSKTGVLRLTCYVGHRYKVGYIYHHKDLGEFQVLVIKTVKNFKNTLYYRQNMKKYPPYIIKKYDTTNDICFITFKHLEWP